MRLQIPTNVSWQWAVACVLTNQLATPGLGSILGRRFVAGIGQLALALFGFGLVLVWFALTLKTSFDLAYSEGPVRSYAWLGFSGAAVFMVSWFWALVTSVSLLRQAAAVARMERMERTQVPPSIPGPPA